jgi:hypothetical protein
MDFQKIFSITILVAVLLALLFLSTRYSLEKETQASLEIERKSNQLLEEIVERRVSYIINKGEGQVLEYNITSYEGATVFSLLDELSQNKDFEMSFTIYPEMGVLVESIDSVKNGTDGKYWQYWVNDELPMLAADKMQIQGGDTVEWKFEAIQF